MSYLMLAAAIAAAIIVLLSGFRIASRYERAVIFRLGRYRALKGPGLYWMIPLIEWRAWSVFAPSAARWSGNRSPWTMSH